MTNKKIGKKSRKRKRRKKNITVINMTSPIGVRQGQTTPLPFNPKDPDFLKELGFAPNSSVNVKMQLQMSDSREENKWIDIPDKNLTGLRLIEDGIRWDIKGLSPDPTMNSIQSLFPIETFFDVQDISVSIMRFSTLHYPNIPNTVVKFTDPKFNPFFCGNIQLGTPAYYRNLPKSPNTENTRDELESIIYDEYEDLTYQEDSYSMYCTTTKDDLSTGREIAEDYQSATRIECPSEFAKALGQEYAEQFIKPFKVLHPQENLHVEIVHGYVHYIDESNGRLDFTGFMKSLGVSLKYVPFFLPFIKRKKYETQREYRFVIRPIGCRIMDNVPVERRFFLLKTTRNVLKLMSLVRSLIPDELILMYHNEDRWLSVRSYNLSTFESIDLNTKMVRKYINLELLDVNVSEFPISGSVNIKLNKGALVQGDVKNVFAFGLTFKEYPYCIILKKLNFKK